MRSDPHLVADPDRTRPHRGAIVRIQHVIERRNDGLRTDQHIIPDPNAALVLELAAGVDKGTGLKRLCDYLKVKPENVMALGDQANDMPMLKYAGLGVAMGNAVDYTKKHADEITADCDHDGVAVAINKIL